MNLPQNRTLKAQLRSLNKRFASALHSPFTLTLGDEFQALLAKNYLPILREEIKAGRIVSLKTYVPSYHGDGRADWTFAMAITYKDEAAFVGPSGEEAIQRRLFPDRATFLKEERRRFEILDAHWDVPLNEVDVK